MSTPVSHLAARTIGTVESVSPGSITVLLETDAPRSVALNTGIPTPFPKINSYVLVPNESGAVVGLVVWLGVERSAYPKRQGVKDFGLVDLPFPLRKMELCPVGTLCLKSGGSESEGPWDLERGVQTYPSVGDGVILPTKQQVTSIVTGMDEDSRLPLGTCPAAYAAAVTVDPDKLFGRHLAVLGNTGSGKSCTVAALIRAAIEKADQAKNAAIPTPNARFILLDPNGEYTKCFKDLGSGCRVFQVPQVHLPEAKDLKLPAWMWNSAEWAAIARAAPGTQRPILQEALRSLRGASATAGADGDDGISIEATIRQALMVLQGPCMSGTAQARESNPLGNYLDRVARDLSYYATRSNPPLVEQLTGAAESIRSLLSARVWGVGQYNSFGVSDVVPIRDRLTGLLDLAGRRGGNPQTEDTPLRFDTSELGHRVESLAALQGANVSSFIGSLVMRINLLLSDARMSDVTCPRDQPRLCDWLGAHIGEDGAAKGQIAVLDLSLVPTEILHLVIAVAGRLVLEALQRYRMLDPDRLNLPTVMVLEEAHTFVAKHAPRGDDIPTPADMCRQTFERIAREGRKFGLGLVLSSQRPSEISETVLSQCNSFLLHRITNDRDQELVTKLVPDTARGLLRELPSLPSRQCLLLGIASRLPVLLEVPFLPNEHRPHSDDPAFWDVWTGVVPRPIDWGRLASDWQGEGTTHGE